MRLNRLSRNLILSAGILLFCYLLFLIRTILTPFLIAFFLAYLLDPVIDFLEGKRIPRLVAIFSLLSILVVLFTLALVILYPMIRLQLEVLLENIPQYIKVIRGWIEPLLERLVRQEPDRLRVLIDEGLRRLGTLPAQLLKGLTNFAWNSLTSLFNLVMLLINLLIIPVATIYFLKDINKIKQTVQAYFPEAVRDDLIAIFREIDQVLSGFIRGQLLIALILAGLYSIGLTLSRTPMSLLIGVVAGFASIIPYLGLLIGLIPALLLSFLQYRTWASILHVLLVFLVVQALEGMIITPRIIGNKIGLHPIMVMIAILLGGRFFGFFGILLAVPAAAVINVLLRQGLRSYKESELYQGTG